MRSLVSSNNDIPVPMYEKVKYAKAVPEYYKEHIAIKAKQCNDLFNSIKNHGIFAFFTDSHIAPSRLTCISLLNELGKITPVKNVFFGGDIPWAFGTDEECLDDSTLFLELCSKMKDNVNLYIARGNHDIKVRYSTKAQEGYVMPYDELRDFLMSYNSNGTNGPKDSMYYYVDDTENKIRYIVLDTWISKGKDQDALWGTRFGMEEEEKQWLVNDALRIKDGGEGWAIVAFGHVSCIPEIRGYENNLDDISLIFRDFKNRRKDKFGDFSNEKADFVAYICGHNHKDLDCVEDNTLFISTSSSSPLKDDIWERVVGTVSE
ncbi:MAG: metallophosphoesterase, partial [Clostridia bacterium]|nr:metallophosphoesterase [Clostridia bacterium]